MPVRCFFRKSFVVPFSLGLILGGMAMQAGAALNGSTIFADVQPGSFYDEAVGEMYGAGIIKGYADGKFHPNDYATRGQIAVMFKRLRDDIQGVTPPAPPPPANSSASSRRARSSSSAAAVSSAQASAGPAGSLHFAQAEFTLSAAAPQISISVMRSGGMLGDVAFAYTLSGGTALPGVDYTPSKGVTTIRSGESMKILSFPLIRNLTSANSRTVILTISSPTGGAVLGTPSSAVITLLAARPSSSSAAAGAASSVSATSAGVMGFSAHAYGVRENAGSITITVLRSGGSVGAVTVNYATSDASATRGINYSPASGTLSFAAGETSKTFAVSVMDDQMIQGNKMLSLTLSSTTGGAALGTLTSVPLTIIDHQGTPAAGSGIIKFSNTSYTVDNSDGVAVITVSRVGSPNGTASVSYQTRDGTARTSIDYTATSGTLTFGVGEVVKSFTIPLTRHAVFEGEKTLNLTLSNASGNSAISEPREVILVIRG